MKPYSEACDQNKAVILTVLQQVLPHSTRLLEIGSGTGQHAIFFAPRLPHLLWHVSDVADNLTGIAQWMQEAPSPNLRGPHELNVNQAQWPVEEFDACFSANTTHIMDWPSVCNMLAGIGARLAAGGIFCLYGPFNEHGQYNSESNARFDEWLKARDPRSGIRDIDELKTEASLHNLILSDVIDMPVNNRILVWHKI